MTTIKEIAKLTNVSTATVSYVLNGKGSVGKAKANQIKELAKKLHYTPNTYAKNLKQKFSKTIGIITEDLTVFNTPDIVDGIDAYCELNGYEMIIGNMRLFKKYNNDFTDTEKHKAILDKIVESMAAKQVQGIIYVGYHCREIIYFPEIESIPFVCAYCFTSSQTASSVIYDDEQAAYDVTNLLIKNGHRKIGILCGPISSFHTQERLQGFQRCLYDNNILYNNNFTFFGDWECESGYKLGGKLIENGVTAIFSLNDVMACGIYNYCTDHNLTVGKDLSLVGFDNRESCQAYQPHLTTVALPLYEIGQKSAQILMDEINGASGIKSHIKIPCHIIQRDSVKNIEMNADCQDGCQ